VLPVGIVSIEGDFRKGDIVKISSEDGTPLGYGMAQYDSTLARERLGRSGEKPLIHYDYLFLKQ
jgi:glutamate 5-kinase